MSDDRPLYVVRAHEPCEGGRTRVVFVDELGRLMHVVVSRDYLLAGGADQAIRARIRAAGDWPIRTR